MAESSSVHLKDQSVHPGHRQSSPPDPVTTDQDLLCSSSSESVDTSTSALIEDVEAFLQQFSKKENLQKSPQGSALRQDSTDLESVEEDSDEEAESSPAGVEEVSDQGQSCVEDSDEDSSDDEFFEEMMVIRGKDPAIKTLLEKLKEERAKARTAQHQLEEAQLFLESSRQANRALTCHLEVTLAENKSLRENLKLQEEEEEEEEESQTPSSQDEDHHSCFQALLCNQLRTELEMVQLDCQLACRQLVGEREAGAQLKEALELEKERMSRASRHIRELEDQINEMFQTLQKRCALEKTATFSLQEEQQRVEDLMKENSELKTNLETLTEDLKEKSSQLSNLTLIHDRMVIRKWKVLDQKDETIAELQQTVETLTMENNSRSSVTSGEVEKLTEALELERVTNQNLQSELRTSKSKEEEATTEYQKLWATLGRFHQTCIRLQAERTAEGDALRKRLWDTEDQLDEEVRRSRKQQAELQEALEKVAALQRLRKSVITSTKQRPQL